MFTLCSWSMKLENRVAESTPTNQPTHQTKNKYTIDIDAVSCLWNCMPTAQSEKYFVILHCRLEIVLSHPKRLYFPLYEMIQGGTSARAKSDFLFQNLVGVHFKEQRGISTYKSAYGNNSVNYAFWLFSCVHVCVFPATDRRRRSVHFPMSRSGGLHGGAVLHSVRILHFFLCRFTVSCIPSAFGPQGERVHWIWKYRCWQFRIPQTMSPLPRTVGAPD